MGQVFLKQYFFATVVHDRGTSKIGEVSFLTTPKGLFNYLVINKGECQMITLDHKAEGGVSQMITLILLRTQ